MTNDTDTDTLTLDAQPWYYCMYRDAPSVTCQWDSGPSGSNSRVEARKLLSDHMNTKHPHPTDPNRRR